MRPAPRRLPVSGPVVSVLMLAWEHGAFIAQAIESVLAQDFEEGFELLIGEDASGDDTLAISETYQARYPELIQVLPAASNSGMHANFKRLWHAARGDYIAFCEGDDYWSDTAKLSKQTRFLEQNPDCTMCGTFTRKIAQGTSGEWEFAGEVRPRVLQAKYSFSDLIGGYHFHFSSVMIRSAVVEFPDWFETVYCVDRPLYLLAAAKGSAGLLPEFTSVYRLHSGGSWSPNSMASKARHSTDLFLKMRDNFPPRYRTRFEASLGAILWSYMAEDLAAGRRSSARQIFWQSLRFTPLRQVAANLPNRVKVALRLYMPLIGSPRQESE